MYLLMVIFIRENSKMATGRVKENIPGQMKVFMMENG
jgi:hypothetical protein